MRILLGLMGIVLAGCQESPKAPAPSVLKPTKKSPLDFLHQREGAFPAHFSLEHLKELTKEDRLKEASRYTNMALQISPQNAALHLINGFLYDELSRQGETGQKELAAIAYRRSHELDPSQWLANYLLGASALEENRFEEAQQHLANALILRPNDPDILYSLAYASYYLKDLPVALSSIRKALALSPDNPAVVRSAIMICASAADFPKAHQHLKKYETIMGPHEPDLQVVTRRIEDWQRFHSQHKVKQASGRAPADSSAEGVVGKSDSGDFSTFQQRQAAGRNLSLDTDVIYVDCYLLQSSEKKSTTKGQNILDSLAFYLGATTDSLSFTRTLRRISTGGNKGAVSGSWAKALTYSITPQALRYSLNIANVHDNRVELIARPSVATLVGKTAYFVQGDQYTGAAGSSTGSAIASVDAGTKVEVTPLEVTPSGLVILEVTLTGSLFTKDPSTKKSITDQLLEVTRSRITTTVKAYLGQTVMLGGIYSRNHTASKEGVPLLQDIPFIQYFFGEERTTSDSRAIIYLLTPRKGGALQDYSYIAAQKMSPVSQRLKERGLMAIGEYPNLYYVIKHVNQSEMFAHFRSGDLPKPFWGYENSSLRNKLEQLKSFLWF